MNPSHPRPAGRPVGAVRSAAYRNAFALAGALAGVAFFLALYGVRVLDVTNADWILNSGADPSQHYLGWQFYRGSELRLPYLGIVDTVKAVIDQMDAELRGNPVFASVEEMGEVELEARRRADDLIDKQL